MPKVRKKSEEVLIMQIQMARTTSPTHKLARLAATTALASLLPIMAMAQSSKDAAIEGCTLTDGRLPDDCSHLDAGTVVTMPVGENTEMETGRPKLNADGFAITIEAANPAVTARTGVDSPASSEEALRRMDRALADAGVIVSYDGLGVHPYLGVSTSDMRSTYTAGSDVAFTTSTNYPAYIKRAEIRILDRDDPTRVIEVLPVAPNGKADWTVPADGTEDMVYSLRVYDGVGRYDETQLVPITRVKKEPEAPVFDGPVIDPGEGEDMAIRRDIPVRGGAVTVSSDNLAPGARVQVMGEEAVADASGIFVMQRILPPGIHDVRVGVGTDGFSRRVNIPTSEWFYVGLVDVTVGTEDPGGSYAIGRVAGYAKGHTKSGYTITGSIDTREQDLEDMFSTLGEKDPDRVLRRVAPEDVYPTFGDDSTSYEDAPTSGKFYLKAEKDNSYVMWGDYKSDKDASRLVRSDRTLYGLQAVHESQAQTSFGEPRLRLSGYAAEPDRLVKRDTLRGTGGSSYFLSQQDIISGTETLMVQWRDPVSGNVVTTRRLTEGTDYRIDYFQGVVILNAPLSASAGSSLISNRPLGSYDVELVAQYEYVPTTGSVDGYSAGGRVEGWVNDHVRLGFSAQKDTTGVADNKVAGVDVLLRQSENTYLSFDVARSEGPGFGSTLSLNGGLDIVNQPTGGSLGNPALAYRIEGAADLSEVTDGKIGGRIKAFYDRKEAGFVSPDYDITSTQTSRGADAEVELTDAATLKLGFEDFENQAGRKRQDTSISLKYDIDALWSVEVGAAHTDRDDLAGVPQHIGTRTDMGARLTWTRDDDLSAWVFGQATTELGGGLPENNRLGIGVSARLTDRLSTDLEVSGGSLGAAGAAVLRYDNNAGSQYHFGYRLDPMRRYDSSTFKPSDGGTWVVGADRQVNDKLTYRAENTYDIYGTSPSLLSSYGVRYTPSDQWTYEGSFEFGESEDAPGDMYRRRGISFGFGYSSGEEVKAGLKAEYRRDSSDTGLRDRDNWLLSGYARYKISEDWRLLANLDALVSQSDQSSLRDGKYIEANLGYAYRPVENDRVNALFKYTYLYDLPGADQVSIDGTLNGPSQKSHILSFDINYDVNMAWTVGMKYGYRYGQIADRLTGVFTKSTADLLVLRGDYHIVHNWDLMVEGRRMDFHETGVTEYGALAGVWRHFGNNIKAGVGYQWGDVSDDLRMINSDKQGVFFNIVGKF